MRKKFKHTEHISRRSRLYIRKEKKKKKDWENRMQIMNHNFKKNEEII